MKLEPGKFYLSRCSDVWCCFRVDFTERKHCQAYCIRLLDSSVDYFLISGRWITGDVDQENDLVAECTQRVQDATNALMKTPFHLTKGTR